MGSSHRATEVEGSLQGEGDLYAAEGSSHRTVGEAAHQVELKIAFSIADREP